VSGDWSSFADLGAPASARSPGHEGTDSRGGGTIPRTFSRPCVWSPSLIPRPSTRRSSTCWYSGANLQDRPGPPAVLAQECVKSSA